MKSGKTIERFDGYWIWLGSPVKPTYTITGKYLFFSENKERLIEIAKKEIENHGFHKAKVNDKLIGSGTEYVLCLYYKDDSRKQEMADRQRQEYPDVKYRYWKSDEDTIKGKYSQEFLQKLSKKDKNHFAADKSEL